MKQVHDEGRVGVIGSSLAGLAAACTLAVRGYEVVLFEKNEWLGGTAAVLEKDGLVPHAASRSSSENMAEMVVTP